MVVTTIMGHRQAVRHSTLTATLAGSNPVGPARVSRGCDPVKIMNGLLAQLVEHLTFNQVVAGSIAAWLIGAFSGCGGTGRRARFRF